MKMKRQGLFVSLSLALGLVLGWVGVFGSGEPARAASNNVLQVCSTCAYHTIQGAINAASDGDVVRVAQGTYYEAITLNKSIALEGGWNSAFTSRDWDNYITTIDAQGTASVIQVHGSYSPTIEGFVITDGDGSDYLGWGGGIEVYGDFTSSSYGTVIIKHNIITDNVACRNTTCQGEGGGIRIGISKAIIEANTIANNVAMDQSGSGKGGGIMIGWMGEATITGNSITNNIAAISGSGSNEGHGGGVYAYSYGGTLNGNDIHGNVAAVDGIGRGGGVYAGGSLDDNRIIDNVASINGKGFGGGVYALYVTNFARNTIQGNIASVYDDSSGGGVWAQYLKNANDNIIIDNAASRGGGVYFSKYYGHLIFRDNYVAFNQATGINTAVPDGGGGISSLADWLEIRDNQIVSNSCNLVGGGVFLSGGTRYILQNNQIISNTAVFGGGVAVFTGTGSIKNNAIISSTAAWGGGLYIWGNAQPELDGNLLQRNNSMAIAGGLLVSVEPTNVLSITNNMIIRNTSVITQGSGVNCLQGDCVLINNTIADNDSASKKMSGVYLGNTANSNTLKNNIIVGHKIGVELASGSSASMDYNDYYDNDVDISGASWGAHHFTDDPQFADRPGDDYHLTSGSPMIDVADASVAPPVDFDGDPRPMINGVDIGADEFHYPWLYIPLVLR